MPSPALVLARAEALRTIRQQVANLLADGRLLDAVALVDQALLADVGDLSAEQIAHIRQARAEFARRRTLRGASGH